MIEPAQQPQVVRLNGGYGVVWPELNSVTREQNVREAAVAHDGTVQSTRTLMTGAFLTPLHSIASPPYLLYVRNSMTSYRAFAFPLETRPAASATDQIVSHCTACTSVKRTSARSRSA